MAAPLKFNQLLDSFAGPQLRRDVSAALFAAADDVRARSRVSISTGGLYGDAHVPSAPGEPPNKDTGFLNDSHETRLPAWNHAQVAVTADYAVPLEYGTSRIEPRPFLGPATRASRKDATKRLTLAIQQAARRAAASVGGR
jgi:hypothetical protein